MNSDFLVYQAEYPYSNLLRNNANEKLTIRSKAHIKYRFILLMAAENLTDM